MTREEAICIVEEIRDDIYNYGTAHDNLSFADEDKIESLNMAIAMFKAEPCEDAVSREALLALKQKFYDNAGYETEYVDVDDIKELPPVTPKPKTGHWISDLKLYGYGKDDYQCSICGRTIHLCRPFKQLTDYPYCHCGARMKSEG